MTKTEKPLTSKQLAQMGAWFLVFGVGVAMIEAWAGGNPFRGSPMSWGLGGTFSVLGGAFLCWAALRRRPQR